MKISATMYQNVSVQSPYPVLTVDDEPLDVWLDNQIPEHNILGGVPILGLVPAQGWLIDEEDLALAWRRILSIDLDHSTIVPLLICPDDMDLTCTVIVTEQTGTTDNVIWRRFGYDFSSFGDQVGATVKWFDHNLSLTFDKSEYVTAILEFKRLTDEVWV